MDILKKIGFSNFWISWGVKDYVAIQCTDYVEDKQWRWLIMFDGFETGFYLPCYEWASFTLNNHIYKDNNNYYYNVIQKRNI